MSERTTFSAEGCGYAADGWVSAADDLFDRISATYRYVVDRLLAERDRDGRWPGRLSDSALSTAVAVSALCLAARDVSAARIRAGAAWLMTHQNSDGGWGDTTDSPSNLATTMLARAALALAGSQCEVKAAAARADAWLTERAGTTMADRAAAISQFYGKDRTFAVPILVNCALAGQAEWSAIPRLPFELAQLSHRWLRRLRIHVVSYALPALIAIGQLLHVKRPTRNPLLRIVRDRAMAPTLRRLESIQPSSGGFIEAVPLTAFVAMSLAGAGLHDHPVTAKALEFLERTVRDNGAWPIDSNLSLWLTSLAINALRAGPAGQDTTVEASLEFLVRSQCRRVHPFTDSPPGGWPWTDLPGGVPDADDTAGALLALSGWQSSRADAAAQDGLRWLIDLQNDDGGWPTFCRGWGKLPFDRSGADLTAHAVRALHAWRDRKRDLPCGRAVRRGLAYLADAQGDDGAWTALWFGNQAAPDGYNRVFGTARVLAAYRDVGMCDATAARRGAAFLVASQNDDGGWGGQRGVASSIEETAVAVETLCAWASGSDEVRAVRRGCEFLIRSVQEGGLDRPAPIGLYFTSLWYSERIYPIIFVVAALGRAMSHWHRMAQGTAVAPGGAGSCCG
jgi:squalene-hopene/tetraprenyl-beta-curcumene cyclase